jgi:hypothetical protein
MQNPFDHLRRHHSTNRLYFIGLRTLRHSQSGFASDCFIYVFIQLAPFIRPHFSFSENAPSHDTKASSATDKMFPDRMKKLTTILSVEFPSIVLRVAAAILRN